MTSEDLQDRSDARVETRRRREERTDAVVELPYNERVRVTCPACGEPFENSISCGDIPSYSPTFGSCPNWECDAFLKFVSDGSEAEEEDDRPAQADLSQFAGGAST